MVQQVTKSAENIEHILSLSGISAVEFVQAMDIKCILIVCGLASASSTNPCPYCNLAKKLFQLYCFAKR